MGKNTKVFDGDLNPVLEIASAEDLAPLVEYITKAHSQSLTEEEGYKKYGHRQPTLYADLIAKHIRLFGGNAFANIARGDEGPSYRKIVCKVASRVKAPYAKSDDTETIEDSIITVTVTRAFEKMSDEDKQKLLKELKVKDFSALRGAGAAALLKTFQVGGHLSYRITVVVANAVAKKLLGRGLAFAANHALVRAAAILTGPIGWVLTGLWTAIDLAGPAYRVVVPCVIQVAMLRKKFNSVNCPYCSTELPGEDTKFCPECGKELK